MKKKYRVCGSVTAAFVITVEADSFDEADDLAYEAAQEHFNGQFDDYDVEDITLVDNGEKY